MSFGSTLQTLRKQKGMSQEELAEKLELTRQTISKWELDQSTPDLEYIIALSDMFQVSADYLIRGEEYAAEKRDSVPVKSAEASNGTGETKLITMWIIMGAVLVLLGLGGVIGFMALAALNPATVWINDYRFDGLFGFLLHCRAVPYFILCVLLLLGGAAMYAALVIKYYRLKKKK